MDAKDLAPAPFEREVERPAFDQAVAGFLAAVPEQLRFRRARRAAPGGIGAKAYSQLPSAGLLRRFGPAVSVVVGEVLEGALGEGGIDCQAVKLPPLKVASAVSFPTAVAGAASAATASAAAPVLSHQRRIRAIKSTAHMILGP